MKDRFSEQFDMPHYDLDDLQWDNTANDYGTNEIVRRFIRRKLGIEKGKKESLKSLIDLLKWTDKFKKVNLPKIREILLPYFYKVIE